jgi:flagellar biosynthesis/type III secretory pathway protein FliH
MNSATTVATRLPVTHLRRRDLPQPLQATASHFCHSGDSTINVYRRLASLYADVIVAELPQALRKAAEEEMRAKTIQYGSDFAKSYHAQGKAEGRAEGKAEGEAEGEAKGEAKAILAVLATRNIDVTSD